MAGPAPELKANQLNDKVAQVVSGLMESGVLNEIAWRSAYNEAISLDGTPSGSYALLSLAVLHAIKRDAEKVDAAYAEYSSNYGVGWDWYSCRAALGLILARPDMVSDLLAFGIPDGDISAHSKAFAYTSQSGFFVSANQILGRLKIMKSETLESLKPDFVREVKLASSYLTEVGISEREIADRVAAAWLVADTQSHAFGRVDLSANEYGISFNFYVKADVSECLRIQKLMDQALVDKFQDPMFEHLSVGVLPN